MKTFRKALSIILGLAMILSCVAGMQISASAEGNLTLSVGEATINEDGTVTVPVIATGSIQAFTATVAYDNALTLDKAEKVSVGYEDSAVVGPTDAAPFKMQFAFALTEADVVLDNTTIANLTFKVADATAETANINLEVTEAWDAAGNAVTATAVDGTVKLVKEPEGPVVDSNLKFQGASVGYGTASLQINFRIRNTVLALYDDVKVVIMPQKYDLTTFNLVEDVPEVVVEQSQLSAAGSTMKSYLYTDIYLYELGLNIDYMLKGYDAEGNLVAVSPVYTTSAAEYLKTVFGTSSDSKFRTLVTDTLVVGAASASQMAAANPDSDLAKAPSIIAGFDISEATPTIDSYNTTNIFNSYNDNFKNTSSTHQFRTSVQIGKAPSITYRLKDSKTALDLSKLSFHVSYSRLNASGQTITFDETFTTANADISLISGWVNFKFDQIGLQGGSTDITTQVIYDGNVVCDSTYSVETYLGAQLNGSIGELAAALIKLGISYRAYSV